MTHNIHGLDLEFDITENLAYQKGELYPIYKSKSSIQFGNCIGSVEVVVDDEKVIGTKMPMFPLHDFTVYTPQELFALRAAINEWDGKW